MARTTLALLALAAILFASPALACSCAGLPKTKVDAAALIEQSDLVALVYIAEDSIRRWVEGDLTKSDIYTRGVVIKSYKGLPENAHIYVEGNRSSSCAPSFALRHIYLIFARGPNPDGRFETSMCSVGTYRADIDKPGYAENNELHQKNIKPTIEAIEAALE